MCGPLSWDVVYLLRLGRGTSSLSTWADAPLNKRGFSQSGRRIDNGCSWALDNVCNTSLNQNSFVLSSSLLNSSQPLFCSYYLYQLSTATVMLYNKPSFYSLEYGIAASSLTWCRLGRVTVILAGPTHLSAIQLEVGWPRLAWLVWLCFAPHVSHLLLGPMGHTRHVWLQWWQRHKSQVETYVSQSLISNWHALTFISFY